MVVSKLDPEVIYTEKQTIDPEDIGYKTPVYELIVAEGAQPISVVIGKPKYIFTAKNIVYFPIYAVHITKIRSQIGLFEIKSASILNIYKNSMLDVSRLQEPILYSFATPEYLANLEASPALIRQRLQTSDESSSQTTSNKSDAVAAVAASVNYDNRTDEEENDIGIGDADKPGDQFILRTTEAQLSKAKLSAQSQIAEGIFVNSPDADVKPPLEEQTKEMANAERTQYKEGPRNSWIEQYMRNSNYRIHEVESNGDCLFAVIRDAFADIGRKTTVAKLRAILANEMTDTVFNQYRTLYMQFQDEINYHEAELKHINDTIKEYKKRIKQPEANISAEDARTLVKQSNALIQQKAVRTKQLEETRELQKDYAGYIKDIQTLDQMRAYVQTSNFWADSWAIATLERVLNVKLVIFSETAFAPASGPADTDGVFICNDVSPELQAKQTFSPDYYILCVYNGNHYRLVSYHMHKIFTFRELPYDVKILAVNRCLSKLAGVYYMIPDFRDFKTKFGIDEDEGAPEDYSESPGRGELFNPDTIFVFYARSDKSVKPGKGDGEKITAENVPKYAVLGTKQFLDWRKMLDDDWGKTPIQIDGHQWTSITHYMQGVRFKKTRPDVYLMFSIDTNPDSELAKSTKAAKAFKGIVEKVDVPTETKTAKVAAKKEKERVVAPDSDFNESRKAEERMVALNAKFVNNVEYRAILAATHDALLLHKEQMGTPPVPDELLMRVRMSILSK